MNIAKIERRVHKIAPSVRVENYRGCVRLTGELDNWQDVYKCGRAAVDKKSLGVLNDITLKGFTQRVHRPNVEDNLLDGVKCDVLVVGGGIVGCAIARELTRYNLAVLLVEKANDVAHGASSRNDGCIHPGIDLHKGQQKLKYVLIGNKMYDQLAKDLDLQLKRWAQTFIFSTIWETKIVAPLYLKRAKQLGVEGVSFISKRQLEQLEPSKFDWATGAMYMATGGVVSPYKTTIAMAESAIVNGAQVALNTIVEDMVLEDGKVVAVKTNRGVIYPRAVVNAAGAYSDVIADMAGDRTFTIHPRKGTDVILDKKKVGYALSSYARSFFAKPKKDKAVTSQTEQVGHTKGGGVMRTVDGNILVGPDAHEIPDREDYTTSQADIDNIILKQRLAQPKLNKGDVITYFAGIRAATYEEDFVVRRGVFTSNVYEAAGIQSPGITAAPAIAVDVASWIAEDLKVGKNENFVPTLKHTPRLAECSLAVRAEYIAKNPAYGEIVCRCEEVSKGEIVDALERPLKVATVDGVKRRVRPGMGRCQGGFCSPIVAKIIAEHEGVDMQDVLKDNLGSVIVYGDTKLAKSKIAGGERNE